VLKLYSQDCAEDLVLRGFRRDAVLAKAGVDVGYNGRSLQGVLAGVDRWAYKLEHVHQRLSAEAVADALDQYSAGAGVDVVLGLLGLANPTLIKLKKLFADLGLSAEFAVADRSFRLNKMRTGMVAKYGVTNPFELAEMQEQAAQTREAKYGARYTLAAGSTLTAGAREKAATPEAQAAALERRRQTILDRYGVMVPFHNPAIRARATRTNFERYGVGHYTQTDEFRESQRQRMLNPDHVRHVQAAARQTSLERYGYPSPNMTDDARVATSRRMKSVDRQRQSLMAKMRNGTFATSSPEGLLHELLVEYFGADDVERQYRDDRYPYACDFYIHSRDLFVELNGSWTHGAHWFDPSNIADSELLATWLAKGSRFYRVAAEVWSQRDPAKRASAAAAGLNYVVFWDGSVRLSDAQLWLALGASDGRDWQREYSWLPQRSLDATEDFPEILDVTKPRSITAAARAANGQVFRGRELAAWQADAVHRTRWGRLQARLYANRLRYLGKLPAELSDQELLRGLGIAGELRSWTVFDNTAMLEVLQRYDVTSVYDPCAGWGERLATCGALGVPYTGVDINAEVVAGHQRMIENYGWSSQSSHVGDAAEYQPGAHDAILTCPPYGTTEIYSEAGAENLDVDAFAAWWLKVVAAASSSGARLFCVQTNQACAATFAAGLAEHGWMQQEVVSLKPRSSHLTRNADGSSRKREYESLQVWVRGPVS